nr:immunoglobulin heavy chain junction region [Mus musculus]
STAYMDLNSLTSEDSA